MDHFVFIQRNKLDAPCVLFQDYNGYWAPLDCLYFSAPSRLLVSRHPDSALEEPVSRYCPQCLKKYSDEEADAYSNRCSTCLQCPCCESLLTGKSSTEETENDTTQCHLVCSYCQWSSLSCGVIGATEEDICSMVLSQEKRLKAIDAYSTVLNSISPKPAPDSTFIKKSNRIIDWNVDSVENMLHENISLQEKNTAKTEALFLSNERNPDDLSSIIQCDDANALSSFHQRISGELVSCSFNSAMNSLLPQRIYLRTKKMLRCRKDVKEGKMSILIQPKSFPLEGDSSHKRHQGHWFQKDSSACHHVPRVVITKLPSFCVSSGLNKSYLHVELVNSRDNRVAVIIEPDVFSESDGSTIENVSGVTSILSQRQPFSFCIESLQSISRPPECVVLGAYEDEFLMADDEIDDSEDFAAETIEPQWNIICSKNVSKLCIPVEVTFKEDHLKYCGIQLSMTVLDIESDEMYNVEKIREEGTSISLKILFPN